MEETSCMCVGSGKHPYALTLKVEHSGSRSKIQAQGIDLNTGHFACGPADAHLSTTIKPRRSFSYRQSNTFKKLLEYSACEE